MVRLHPNLQTLIQDGRGRRLSNNTIEQNLSWRLSLSVRAMFHGDLRRFKGNFLYADEIDAIAITETDEGDQLRQLQCAASEYPDTIQVYSASIA